MLISKIVKILTCFMVIIARPALSDANLVNVFSVRNTSPRDVIEELDPDDIGDCLSLGELEIVFRTGNDGHPHVGVVLTDPRGAGLALILLSNRLGRHYLSPKVISIAMIWVIRIPAEELSRCADRSAEPIGSK